MRYGKCSSSSGSRLESVGGCTIQKVQQPGRAVRPMRRCLSGFTASRRKPVSKPSSFSRLALPILRWTAMIIGALIGGVLGVFGFAHVISMDSWVSMANCYFAKPHGMQHCYIPFLYVIDFKGAPDFGEAQPTSMPSSITASTAHLLFSHYTPKVHCSTP